MLGVGWQWVVRVLSVGWDVLGKGRKGLGGGWDGLDKRLGGGWEIARTPPIGGAVGTGTRIWK